MPKTLLKLNVKLFGKNNIIINDSISIMFTRGSSIYYGNIKLNFDLISLENETNVQKEVKDVEFKIDYLFESKRYNSKIYKLIFYKFPYFNCDPNEDKRDLVLLTDANMFILGAYFRESIPVQSDKSTEFVYSFVGDLFPEVLSSQFEFRTTWECD